jgi:hypothetical protein
MKRSRERCTSLGLCKACWNSAAGQERWNVACGCRRGTVCTSELNIGFVYAVNRSHLAFLSARFDLMGHAILKSYRGIRNVIFRVSGINTTTTLEGEPLKNSVLLNSHIDSALPSKGSAE